MVTYKFLSLFKNGSKTILPRNPQFCTISKSQHGSSEVKVQAMISLRLPGGAAPCHFHYTYMQCHFRCATLLLQ